ncbi:hypothetical protein HY495_02435 [Candidatus Woesearchaeota archaeon]|nr:hypothetical protein [Candidatus Woesearchaeota archaeon]
MAKVEIVRSLFVEINKKFKQKTVEVLEQIKSLEDNPHKGKLLGTVGGILIKELKYEGFRFYFVVDGYRLRCYSEAELITLLIRFVRMSDKKQQQQTIGEIKYILQIIGLSGFS